MTRTRLTRGCEFSSVVEHLSGKDRALSSIPSNPSPKKRTRLTPAQLWVLDIHRSELQCLSFCGICPKPPPWISNHKRQDLHLASFFHPLDKYLLRASTVLCTLMALTFMTKRQKGTEEVVGEKQRGRTGVWWRLVQRPSFSGSWSYTDAWDSSLSSRLVDTHYAHSKAIIHIALLRRDFQFELGVGRG